SPLKAGRSVRGSHWITHANLSGISGTKMEQFKGLWRDTKYIWIGFVSLLFAIGMLGAWYYLLLLPCLPVAFVYFAFIRYDEEGNEKGDFT
ncbi:MAG: hypothetical protein ACF787_07745, partial [Rhodopirellula sp. JB053]